MGRGVAEANRKSEKEKMLSANWRLNMLNWLVRKIATLQRMLQSRMSGEHEAEKFIKKRRKKFARRLFTSKCLLTLWLVLKGRSELLQASAWTCMNPNLSNKIMPRQWNNLLCD